MFRLALKNLWHRRKSLGWLTIELIIVSLLAWYLIDKTAVQVYNNTRPMGYDYDQLVRINFGYINEESSSHNPASADSTTIMRNVEHILDEVRGWGEVESATICIDPSLENLSSWNSTVSTLTDTISVNQIRFFPEKDFFRTFGITTPEGYTPIEELNARTYADGEVIITKSALDNLKLDKRAIGKPIGFSNQESILAGVINDIRTKSIIYETSVALQPITQRWTKYLWEMYKRQPFFIVARLKDGVDINKFIETNDSRIYKELRVGNFYVDAISSFPQLGKRLADQQGVTDKIRTTMILLVFFVVCVGLGVVGSFWLQTRRRNIEAGVMKSFGASPRYIRTMMLIEGAILTVITWAIGCFLRLQHALKEGFEQGETTSNVYIDNGWVTNFSEHFIIISTIVLVVMLAMVELGIYIPARKISKVNPVDALRDE